MDGAPSAERSGDRFARTGAPATAGSGMRWSWSTATWRALARRYRGRGESIEDLEQVALLGLVKAVERFEPGLGIPFPNFAFPTIEGELKRHFRGQWIVRVPRSLQERVLDLGRTIDELTNLNGRSPTLTELARAMGETEELLLEAMEARLAYSAVALDPPDQDSSGDAAGGRSGQEDGRLIAVERGLLVESLLEHLAPREQVIIRLRFFDELTQSEIARGRAEPDAGLPAHPAFTGAPAGFAADP